MESDPFMSSPASRDPKDIDEESPNLYEENDDLFLEGYQQYFVAENESDRVIQKWEEENKKSQSSLHPPHDSRTEERPEVEAIGYPQSDMNF